MAGIGPVREEKREGEVEREGSTRNGWESLAVGWSLGLVNHGGLERERERFWDKRDRVWDESKRDRRNLIWFCGFDFLGSLI